MPSIPPGVYHIRYLPTNPPFPIGGAYATSDGLNAQLSAKALRPPFEQTWIIAPVVGPNPDAHTIILASPIGPRAGWGLGGGEPIHVPVVLLNRFRDWIINEAVPGNRIYHILDPSPIIGVRKAVALDGERLFVNNYPEGAPLPLWQITPAGIED